MRIVPFLASGAVALASLTTVGATIAPAHAAPGDTAYALAGSSLLSFDITTPGAVTSTAITGVRAGETLVGMDVRPRNGQLYALGIDAAADTGTLYVLHEQTGYAAAVGTPGSVAFTDGVNPIGLPDPATTGYGFDVNPVADRVRVVASNGLNFRINPSTGAPIDGDNGGGVTTGTNPDGVINGGTTTLAGAAYTNDLPDGSVTTLYTLDASTDSLFIQAPANIGTQTQGKAVTLGGSPLDFAAASGFDIAPGVDATTSNVGVASGSGYAVLRVGGVTGLYAIDLVTGAATSLGTVGDGQSPITGLALQRDIDDGLPAVGLTSDGLSLVRFSTTAPGTTSTVALNLINVVAGQSLAAVTWRTQTGQLYALGVDASSNTASLYQVDPQTGLVSTPVGGPSQLTWTNASATTVDLPDPATTGYGFDANPAVDRLRITTAAGFNARANPVTGQAVDGNLGSASTITGVNPDGATGRSLAAVGYTNAYGSDLLGGTPTTLYALDPTADQIVVVNPPNNGTATLPLSLTSGGAAVDVSPLAGLDIPEGVTVTTSGTPATGTAYATLVVGGTPGLYAIDLATGQVTSRGTMTGALRSLALGAAGANRVVPAPAPTTPTTPTTAPSPSAVLSKVAAARQRTRTVDTGRSLACPATFASSTCATKIRVTATYRVAGKRKPRSAVLATRSVSTPRGDTTRLKVTLTKKGVKLLKKRKRLAARVAITAPTGPAAAAATTVVKVKLRKKKL